MGEKTREALKLQFDKRLRLEFHGARITSDAGLNHMSLSLSINRFGRRLIMRGIRPEDVISQMLHGL